MKLINKILTIKFITHIKLLQNWLFRSSIPTKNKMKLLVKLLQMHSLTQLNQLVDIACIDTLSEKYRFQLVYVFYSVMYNYNVYIKYPIKEGHAIPSLAQVYASANWAEREVWDLFGIFFKNHPDLRRIVTDYGFQGHALRKDFPVTGFSEIYYNDSGKLLSYEKVELSQELRQTNSRLKASKYMSL